MVVKVNKKLLTTLVNTVTAFSNDVSLVVDGGRCGFSNFDTNLYSHLDISIECDADEEYTVAFDPVPLMQFLKLADANDTIQILNQDKLIVSSPKQRVSIAKYLPRENKPGVDVPVSCDVSIPSKEFLDTIKVASDMGGQITWNANAGQIVAKIGDDSQNTIEYDYTIDSYTTRPEGMTSATYLCELIQDMKCIKEFDTVNLKYSTDSPIIISGSTENLSFKLLVANKIGAS